MKENNFNFHLIMSVITFANAIMTYFSNSNKIFFYAWIAICLGYVGLLYRDINERNGKK